MQETRECAPRQGIKQFRLPPGLHPFYNRVFVAQLRRFSSCEGMHATPQGECWPIDSECSEVKCVSGLSDEWVSIEGLVDRCVHSQDGRNDIEFVHQSARDYLTGENGHPFSTFHEYLWAWWVA